MSSTWQELNILYFLWGIRFSWQSSPTRGRNTTNESQNFTFNFPGNLVSPRVKHISEETSRRIMFYSVPWTQSRCMLIFSICLHILSLNIRRNIDSLCSKIFHCLPRGNLPRFITAKSWIFSRGCYFDLALNFFCLWNGWIILPT